jgi:hypothetical protein
MIDNFADGYQAYRRAAIDYRNAMSPEEIRRVQDEKWNEYLELTARWRSRDGRVVPAARVQVVERARGKLPSLPRNWNPDDRLTFVQAVAEQVVQKSRATWEAAMVKQFGTRDMPTNLEAAALFARAEVQRKLRDELAIPPAAQVVRPLPYTLDLAVVTQRVYRPLLADAVRETIAFHYLPETAYASGGSEEQLGTDSVQRVVVPPVALLFSLTGGLAHVFKLGYLLLLVIGIRRSFAWLGMATMATGLATVPLILSNSITSSSTYQVFEDWLSDEHPVAPIVLRWIIHAESMAYPVTDSLRRYVLMGFGFGWNG